MPHRGGGHRIRFPRGPLLIETVAADAVGKLDVVAPREVKSPGASSGAFDETSETLIEPDALHPQSHSANQAEASFGGIGPTANESSHPLEKRYFGSCLICYTRPANGWRRNFELKAPPSGVKSNHLVMRGITAQPAGIAPTPKLLRPPRAPARASGRRSFPRLPRAARAPC